MATVLPLPGGVKFESPEPSADQPSNGKTRYRWKFKNLTGEEIYDFKIITNLTAGVDPDVVKIKIKSKDGKMTYYPPPKYDDDTGDEVKDENGETVYDEEDLEPGTEVEIDLDTYIDPDEDFEIVIETDGPLESDEGIVIQPTDLYGEKAGMVWPGLVKEWDWGQLWGWGLGGGLFAAGLLALINWLAGGPAGELASWITGGSGGFAGGCGGYILSYLFDDKRIRWTFKSAFLFSFWFTGFMCILIFSMIWDWYITELLKGVSEWKITTPWTALAGLMAASLSGVLNNLLIRENPSRKRKGKASNMTFLN